MSIDSASAELAWYFLAAEYESEIAFLYATSRAVIPDDSSPGITLAAIAKARRVRNRLQQIGGHADVLAAAFSPRQYGPRLLTLVGAHPGVAAHCVGTRRKFAKESPRGRHGARAGVWGWLSELSLEAAKLVRAEASAVQRAALDAYDRTGGPRKGGVAMQAKEAA